MEKKFQDFSMEEVAKLAKSPAAQQLMALLKQQNSGQLEQAVAQAKKGDYAQASQTLSSLLSSEEGKRLMKELGGK